MPAGRLQVDARLQQTLSGRSRTKKYEREVDVLFQSFVVTHISDLGMPDRLIPSPMAASFPYTLAPSTCR